MKFGFNLFLLCLLFTSCQSILCLDEDSDYKNIVDFGRQAKKEYQVQLVGLGGGFHDGIGTFNLTFLSFQMLSLEESRILFYQLANKFLEKINADEKLKKKSNVDQFTIEHISLMLMFPEETQSVLFVSNGNVNMRSPLQLVYFFSKNALGECECAHEETYEELKNSAESQLQHQF